MSIGLDVTQASNLLEGRLRKSMRSSVPPEQNKVIELLGEGERCYRSGHYSQALLHHLKVLNLRQNWYQGTPHAEVADSLTRIGMCYYQLGKYEDALQYVQEALAIQETLSLTEVKESTCLASLNGHSDAVRSVSFSPDGSKIVSGADDRTVRIWDVTTGRLLATLNGHTRTAFSVNFSPDGTKIISGSFDGTVRVWNIVGTCLITLKGQNSWMWGVSFSPDGTKIISGSSDYSVWVWDAATSACLAVLRGHTKEVLSVSFSPDGTKVVSGSYDNTVRIWEVVNGTCLTILSGHTREVQSASFSPDGTKVVSGSYDNTVRIWDVVKGTCLATLNGHTNLVRSVSFSPDGTKIVSGSDDYTIRVWDAAKGTCLSILKGHNNYVWSVNFSPDGTKIVSGGADRIVLVWDVIKVIYPSISPDLSRSLVLRGTIHLGLGEEKESLHMFQQGSAMRKALITLRHPDPFSNVPDFSQVVHHALCLYVKGDKPISILVIQQLLNHDSVDIDAKNRECYTIALQWAAFNGHKEAVEILVKKKIDIHATNENSKSALDLAKEKGHQSIALVIEEAIKKGEAFLAHTEKLITESDLEAFTTYCIENPAYLMAQDRNGRGLLHYIAQYNPISHKKMVHFLVSQGVSINAQDKEGNTPLHTVQHYHPHSRLIQALIAYEADQESVNLYGEKADIHHTSREWLTTLVFQKANNVLPSVFANCNLYNNLSYQAPALGHLSLGCNKDNIVSISGVSLLGTTLLASMASIGLWKWIFKKEKVVEPAPLLKEPHEEIVDPLLKEVTTLKQQLEALPDLLEQKMEHKKGEIIKLLLEETATLKRQVSDMKEGAFTPLFFMEQKEGAVEKPASSGLNQLITPLLQKINTLMQYVENTPTITAEEKERITTSLSKEVTALTQKMESVPRVLGQEIMEGTQLLIREIKALKRQVKEIENADQKKEVGNNLEVQQKKEALLFSCHSLGKKVDRTLQHAVSATLDTSGFKKEHATLRP